VVGELAGRPADRPFIRAAGGRYEQPGAEGVGLGRVAAVQTACTSRLGPSPDADHEYSDDGTLELTAGHDCGAAVRALATDHTPIGIGSIGIRRGRHDDRGDGDLVGLPDPVTELRCRR
jgi:hypothetical protein